MINSSDTRVRICFKMWGSIPENIPDWILVLPKKYESRHRFINPISEVTEIREPVLPSNIAETLAHKWFFLNEVTIREKVMASGKVYHLIGFTFLPYSDSILDGEPAKILKTRLNQVWDNAEIFRNSSSGNRTSVTILFSDPVKTSDLKFDEPDTWGIRRLLK